MSYTVYIIEQPLWFSEEENPSVVKVKKLYQFAVVVKKLCNFLRSIASITYLNLLVFWTEIFQEWSVDFLDNYFVLVVNSNNETNVKSLFFPHQDSRPHQLAHCSNDPLNITANQLASI
jgi:hypothetical protein